MALVSGSFVQCSAFIFFFGLGPGSTSAPRMPDMGGGGAPPAFQAFREEEEAAEAPRLVVAVAEAAPRIPAESQASSSELAPGTGSGSP